MWYGDGENEPYTTDLALTALGRLYVLSMQYLMETYNDSTSLLSALLLHTFSPEEWLGRSGRNRVRKGRFYAGQCLLR